ncbi:phosphatase PAP2 family protein [Actinomadura rayongensis]|uniref:phosphatase PAP2 family protein n=1 Tax=Actinomadura rayongensis TaxID=1429076 RepID=UPI00136CE411
MLGTPLVFAGAFLVARALSARSVVPPALLDARAQLTGTLGPGGAALTLYGAGVFLLTAVGLVLGEIFQRIEHPVDWAVFHWIEDVQRHGWAEPMRFLGQMGNIPETRGTAAVAAVVLTVVAVLRRERWWVPAVIIGGTVLVQKFDNAALAKVVNRGHPPTTLGTYPSGGCGRTLAIYGTVVLVALAYTRAGRTVRCAAWSLIVTMAFMEGYTRTYLNKHWVTDVLGGWAVGGMLLVVTVFACRVLLPRTDGAPNGGATDTFGHDRVSTRISSPEPDSLSPEAC